MHNSNNNDDNDARWLRDAQTREQLLGEVTRQAGLQFRKTETQVA